MAGRRGFLVVCFLTIGVVSSYVPNSVEGLGNGIGFSKSSEDHQQIFGTNDVVSAELSSDGGRDKHLEVKNHNKDLRESATSFTKTSAKNGVWHFNQNEKSLLKQLRTIRSSQPVASTEATVKPCYLKLCSFPRPTWIPK